MLPRYIYFYPYSVFVTTIFWLHIYKNNLLRKHQLDKKIHSTSYYFTSKEPACVVVVAGCVVVDSALGLWWQVVWLWTQLWGCGSRLCGCGLSFGVVVAGCVVVDSALGLW